VNLHEYQSKALLASFGLPVPFSVVLRNVDEVADALKNFSTEQVVAKVQVHAGGRGKAGGVKVLPNQRVFVEDFVRQFIGQRLVTYQTTSEGQPVHKILLEAPSAIERELYLAIMIDRASRSLTLIASTEGGVDIEQVAHHTPEKIFTLPINSFTRIQPYQARDIGFKLGFNATQCVSFYKIMAGAVHAFFEKDLSMLEINPLVVTKQGDLLCLDAKITIDDNALYRQQTLLEQRDLLQEDQREALAKQWELSYIALEGNIGCMVNGAGLAMATMDLIKLHGGQPANFLDVGGGATKERVTAAFKIILSDINVKAILVNIFGGIVRCDLIAEGIIEAVKEMDLSVPVVVRLEGNNAQLARSILDSSQFNIIAAESLTEAAQKAVAATGAQE
jgi:succinyl-CoA synthetase beta subunit